MSYGRLSPKLMLQLAAPHTWPASVLPVALSITVVQGVFGYVDCGMSLILLAICILLQSAVNTFNDYVDYRKGADTLDNQPDPTDAVLVYNNIKPGSALALAIVFVVAAFALGSYIVWLRGAVPLIIAIIGAIVVFLYSGGKLPISYLPIGEAVSGITMGLLIPLACVYSLVGQLYWPVLLYALPIGIGIGLIMMTNNTCDIEKDIEADRRTLPVVLGRARARGVYHGLMAALGICAAALCAVASWQGLLLYFIVVVVAYPGIRALVANPLDLAHRMQAMPQCLNFNIVMGLGYCFALLLGFYAA